MAGSAIALVGTGRQGMDETFQLDAKGRITLWLSNAGAVRATVGGVEYELGRPGEVGTRTIAWRKDAASGAYVLEIAPLY